MKESNGMNLIKEIDWESYLLINQNSLANSIITALSTAKEIDSGIKITKDELLSLVLKDINIEESNKTDEKFDYLLNDLIGRKIININYDYENGISNAYYELTAKNFVTRELLIKYWEDVPIVKPISSKLFNLLDEHPIRYAITQVLREGIEENDSKRHALSLKELLPLVNKFLKTKYDIEHSPIKMTALYYHRDKLIEDGLIKEVATFLEGKRYVTYYGRTAKAYIVREGFEEEKGKFLSDFKKILKAISKENDSLINEIVKNLEVSIQKITKEFDQWFENNVNIINKLDIDVISLYKLIGELYFIHPEYQELSKEIYKLLKLPKYEKID